MDRPSYSPQDFDAALRSNPRRHHECLEENIIAELRRLLDEGHNDLADLIAADFLNRAPWHRRKLRAHAILNLVGERCRQEADAERIAS